MYRFSMATKTDAPSLEKKKQNKKNEREWEKTIYIDFFNFNLHLSSLYVHRTYNNDIPLPRIVEIKTKPFIFLYALYITKHNMQYISQLSDSSKLNTQCAWKLINNMHHTFDTFFSLVGVHLASLCSLTCSFRFVLLFFLSFHHVLFSSNCFMWHLAAAARCCNAIFHTWYWLARLFFVFVANFHQHFSAN